MAESSRFYFQDVNEQDFSWTETEQGITITGYKGAVNDIVIPEKIAGKPVVSIGGRQVLTIERIRAVGNDSCRVRVPSSVRYISPAALKSAGYWKWKEGWIEDLEIDPENPWLSWKNRLLMSADQTILYACMQTEEMEIRLPETIREIGPHAFYYFPELDLLEMNNLLPKGVQKIGTYAFPPIPYGHRSRKSEVLPDGISEIGCEAIGEKYETILQGYYGSLSDEWRWILPASVQNLQTCIGVSWENVDKNPHFSVENGIILSTDGKTAYTCLRSDDSIKELEIPKSVEIIRDHAFIGLPKLQKVTFGSNLRKIGPYAFLLAKIKTIRIPESLEEIGDHVFDFKWVKSVIIHKNNKRFFTDKICLFERLENEQCRLIGCFADNVDEYSIPEGTVEIDDGAFTSCENLRKLVLPESLKTIREKNLPPRLSEIIGSKKLEQIEWMEDRRSDLIWRIDSENDFYFDDNGVIYRKTTGGLILERFQSKENILHVADECTEIKEHACEKAESLKELVLPAALCRIGAYAFAESGLKNLKVPEGVRQIGDYAFFCCSLKQIELTEGLENIGVGAFSGNDLSSVFIPRSVRYIGLYAFSSNPLQKYSVGEGNRDYFAIDGCLYSNQGTVLCDVPEQYAKTEVVLPESVREIGTAFLNCRHIQKITLPESVKYLWAHSIGEERVTDTDILELRMGKEIRYIHPWFVSEKKGIKIYAPADSCVRELIIEKRKQGRDTIRWKQILPEMETMASGEEEYEVFPNKDGVTIDCCRIAKPVMEIPETIHGKPVTEIGPFAFFDTNTDSRKPIRIEQITVPNSVSRIQDKAFYDCQELRSLAIPKSVSEIGEAIIRVPWNAEVTVYVEKYSMAERYFQDIQSTDSDDGENILIEPIEESGSTQEQADSDQADCFQYEVRYDKTVVVTVRQDLPKRKHDELTVPTTYRGQTVNSFRFTATGGVKKLHIPATITNINWSSYDGTLLSLTIDEKNPNYATDGYAIFDKSRESLLRMICWSLEQYAVPEGIHVLKANAFYGCRYLKEISLPASLTEIEGKAFLNCENLSEIMGLETVDQVALDALQGTKWLQNRPVWIQKNTLMKYRYMDEPVYRIPEGVETIGEIAFYDSYSNPTVLSKGERAFLDSYYKPIALSEVFFPDSLREISRCAFYSCKNLKEIHWNKGLETIDSYAFGCCNMLQNVVLPASLKELGDRAFAGTAISAFQIAEDNTCFITKDGIIYSADMSKLIMVPEQLPLKVFEVPDGVKEICAYAFSDQQYLEGLVLPESVEIIHTGAFEDCRKLNHVQMTGVKEVKKYAFLRCDNLKKIELNDGLRVIEMNAFYGCEVVKTVEVYDSIEPELDAHHSSVLGTLRYGNYGNSKTEGDYDVIVRSSQTGEIKYIVTMAGAHSLLWGSNAKYEFSRADREFSKLNKDNKLRMAAYRLMYPVDLTTEMRDTYEKYLSRMSKAFVMYCIDQQDMEMLRTFESLGILKKNNIDELLNYAAENGTVEFSAYLMEYKQVKFGGIKKEEAVIPELELPKKIVEWKLSSSAPGRVMRYRGNDMEVIFPEMVDGKTVVGIADTSAKTPDNYKKIVSVTIPEGYQHIGKYAFKGCEKLEKISLPSTLQTIDKAAFQGCTSLKEIELPDSVTSIGENAFRHCTLLSKVRLSRKLWTIPFYAFGGCRSLRTIDIPPYVGSLEKGCFETEGALTVNIHGLYVSTFGSCFSNGVRINHFPCGLSRNPYGVPTKSRFQMNLAFRPGKLSVEVLMKDNDNNTWELSFIKEMTGYTIQQNESEKLDQLIESATEKEALQKCVEEIYPEMEREIISAAWKVSEKEADADIVICEVKESEDGKTITVYRYRFETAEGTMEKKDTYTLETRHSMYESRRDIENRIMNGENAPEGVNEIEKWTDITNGLFDRE